MRLKMIQLLLVLLAVSACSKTESAKNPDAPVGGSGTPPPEDTRVKTVRYYLGERDHSDWDYDVWMDFTSVSGYKVHAKDTGTTDCYYHGSLSVSEANELFSAMGALDLHYSTGVKVPGYGVDYLEVENMSGNKTRIHLMDVELNPGEIYADDPEASDLSDALRDAIDDMIDNVDVMDPAEYSCG
jgi:hypothetical protein